MHTRASRLHATRLRSRLQSSRRACLIYDGIQVTLRNEKNEWVRRPSHAKVKDFGGNLATRRKGYGIGSLPDRKKKHRLLEAATTMFDEYFFSRIYPFDQLAAIEYADVVLHKDRIGTPMSMPDAQIAAICIVSGAEFATRNTKDFENTGFVLINPWEM